MSHNEYSGGGRFPATRWSVIAAACSEDVAERAHALDALCAAYWKPVYKYIRLRWNRVAADAQDLTQGFFAERSSGNSSAALTPTRAGSAPISVCAWTAS